MDILKQNWNRFSTWFSRLSVWGKVVFGLIVIFIASGGWALGLILIVGWWIYSVSKGTKRKKLEQEAIEAKAYFAPIIDSKKLPIVKTLDVKLQKEEQCYYVEENVPLAEERSVRLTRGGGGSFRVMKGVWAHSYSSQSVSQQKITRVDNGTIFITNKRIIYLGRMRNKNIKYDDILATHQYNDAISIALASTGKNEYFLVQNPMIFKGIMSLAPYGDNLKKVKNIDMQFQISPSN